MKHFPKCQMHCLFFTASTMWGTGLVISFPGYYLNKQPMNKAREGKKQLTTSSFKAAANSNTQVPSLSEHKEQKSSSVWKHTFNLSSEITKLIPKDNGGYSSTSASQGRKRGKGLQSKKQRKGGPPFISLSSQEAEQKTTSTQCCALAIPSAKTTEIK